MRAVCARFCGFAAQSCSRQNRHATQARRKCVTCCEDCLFEAILTKQHSLLHLACLLFPRSWLLTLLACVVGAAREIKRKGEWGEGNSNPLPFLPDVVLATNFADRAEALWREYFSVVLTKNIMK